MSSFQATFKGIFRAFFELCAKARKKRARFELFAELFFALVSSYLFSTKKVGQIRAIFRATEIELFSSYFLTLGCELDQNFIRLSQVLLEISARD